MWVTPIVPQMTKFPLAIIWTNAGLVYWRIYASLDLND